MTSKDNETLPPPDVFGPEVFADERAAAIATGVESLTARGLIVFFIAVIGDGACVIARSLFYCCPAFAGHFSLRHCRSSGSARFASGFLLRDFF